MFFRSCLIGCDTSMKLLPLWKTSLFASSLASDGKASAAETNESSSPGLRRSPMSARPDLPRRAVCIRERNGCYFWLFLTKK